MSSPQHRSRIRRQHASTSTRPADTDLPVHLALSYVLVRTFTLNSEGTTINVYSATFTGKILELICREVYEVNDTVVTFSDLKGETDSLTRAETASIARQNEKLRSRGQAISAASEEAEKPESWLDTFSGSFRNISDGCALLDTLEKDVRDRMNEEEDEDITELPEPIERRSPLGIFLRGLLLTLRKLTFDETSLLAHQVAEWCGHNAAGPSHPFHYGALNRKAAMQDTLTRRTNAIEQYQTASGSGDFSGALASLRRFYDYEFPASGRGQHQHALLNLATFHYSTGGFVSAKSAVEEAIRVARAENDKACLKSCMSLMHRLTTESSSSAFLPSEKPQIPSQPISDVRISKSSNSMHDLWALRAALDMGEPTHLALRRIHVALARHEEGQVKLDGKKEHRNGVHANLQLHMGAWHASQAALWSMIGCEDLATLHEDMAIEVSADDADTRLTVLMCRAQRASLRGQYGEALSMMLAFDVINDMSLALYHRWTRQVWMILERRASFSDDQEALDIIAVLRPPHDLGMRIGPGGSTREMGQPLSHSGIPDPALRGIPLTHEQIVDSLRKARKLKDASTPPNLVMSHVLSTVHLAADLGLWKVYRSGIILLAECIISLEADGMAQKAYEEINRIWDQLVASGSEEDISRGALIMGKAALDAAMSADQDGVLDEGKFASALQYLQQALTSARVIGHRRLTMDCTTLLSLLADIQGQPDGKLVEAWRSANIGDIKSLNEMRDEIRRVGEIVKLVGVRVAEAWK